MEKREDSAERSGRDSNETSGGKNTPAGQLFDELCRLSSFLRTEEGCPWDRAQTLDTMTPYLLEEACEAIEAVEHGDMDRLREELGDLLYLVVFMADIAGSEGKFTTGQVLDGIRTKLHRRHPHVFGTQRNMTPDQVKSQWERIKKDEGAKRSILKDYPASMPGLTQAYRVQEKAAAVGFDWERTEQVADKVEEELGEVRAALSKAVGHRRPAEKEPAQDRPRHEDPGLSEGSSPSREKEHDRPAQQDSGRDHLGQEGPAPSEAEAPPSEEERDRPAPKGSISQELGDLLFAVVNLCRFTGTDPERAIRGSVDKFRRRFRYIEEQLEKRGSHPGASTLEEMDELWNEAKRKGI